MALKTTRFSGADWADQLHPIILVGVGGIGSWLALNLSRIGHELFLIDPDTVDETNVTGGQMYMHTQVGMKKVQAVQALCRALGVTAPITAMDVLYTEEAGMTDICITGLDNMTARKLVFDAWKKHVEAKETEEEKAKCLLIDGRLTLEMFEVLTVQGNRPDQMEHYEREFLFSDEETVELDCTTKQSTFGAMGISCYMTATLCNWLTNQKLGMDFRETPLYQRHFFPAFDYRQVEAGGENTSAAPVVQAALLLVEEPAVQEGHELVPTEAVLEAPVVEAKIPSESVERLKSLFI